MESKQPTAADYEKIASLAERTVKRSERIIAVVGQSGFAISPTLADARSKFLEVTDPIAAEERAKKRNWRSGTYVDMKLAKAQEKRERRMARNKRNANK